MRIAGEVEVGLPERSKWSSLDRSERPKTGVGVGGIDHNAPPYLATTGALHKKRHRVAAQPASREG